MDHATNGNGHAHLTTARTATTGAAEHLDSTVSSGPARAAAAACYKPTIRLQAPVQRHAWQEWCLCVRNARPPAGVLRDGLGGSVRWSGKSRARCTMLPCHHEALLRTGPVRPWDRHHAAVPTPVPLHVTQRIADSWLARGLAVTLRGNVWAGVDPRSCPSSKLRGSERRAQS